MKDAHLNERLKQQEAKTIELLWAHDLLSPSKTGNAFTKNGLRAVIKQENIDAANALFAQGAKDVRFTAHRVDGFSPNEVHFVLDSFEIVRT
jgi:hypothetical protein